MDVLGRNWLWLGIWYAYDFDFSVYSYYSESVATIPKTLTRKWSYLELSYFAIHDKTKSTKNFALVALEAIFIVKDKESLSVLFSLEPKWLSMCFRDFFVLSLPEMT